VDGVFHSFKFSNYRSFADETIFDMTATSIQEHKDSVLYYENNKVGVLPVTAIYGANASGKSSFFMALSRMRKIIINKRIDENASSSFTTPFYFEKSLQEKPTSYEITFSIRETKYIYGFKCTSDKILSESLYKQKLSKTKTQLKAIFEIDDSGKLIECSSDQAQKKEIEYCMSMQSNKSLLLADLGLRDRDKETNEIFYFILGLSIYNNLDLYSKNTPALMDMLDFMVDKFNDVELSISNEIIKLIKDVDESIIDLQIKKIDTPDGKKSDIKTIHLKDGIKEEFPLENESEGTRQFLAVIMFMLKALSFGEPIFIDELDSKLHPLLLRKIVRMFKNKQTNPHNAQLIFSAHNIINLDSSDLRRDEIWFVEKNNQKSEMYSLFDFKEDGVRSDLSFGKYYLAGRFGAIPFQNKKDDEKSVEELLEEYNNSIKENDSLDD